MDITVFPFMKMTATSPLSSHHRDAVVMKLHWGPISPQGMATPVALMNKDQMYKT